MEQAQTQRFEDRTTEKTLECTECDAKLEQKFGEDFEGKEHFGCGGEFQ